MLSGVSSFLEVLDTENPSLVCQPVPNFPIPMNFPVYGLLNDNTTIFSCVRTIDSTSTRCFKLMSNAWLESEHFKQFFEVLKAYINVIIFSLDSSWSCS
jgi:hypothetical protein